MDGLLFPLNQEQPWNLKDYDQSWQEVSIAIASTAMLMLMLSKFRLPGLQYATIKVRDIVDHNNQCSDWI